MTEFNASNERHTLDKMTQGFDYESNREGGNIVASGLQQAIKDAWCRLTPDQRAATSAAAGEDRQGTTILQDGSGEYIAIKAYGGGVVPLHCDK